MDVSSVVILLAVVVAAAWLVPRVLVDSVGRAGEGMAALFVPPDRSLGWPRGVQESDAPWGWRSGPAAPAVGPSAPEDQTGLADFDVTEVDGWPVAGAAVVIAPERVRRR